jgi:23S rRNA pseudouridine2605 synthase
MEITSYLQSQWYSRRKIISLLSMWEVFVNGEPVSYRKTVLHEWDSIEIKSEYQKYIFSSTDEKDSTIILFNKPIWYTVSKADEHNQTIYDILPKERSQTYYYIGRLDKDSHWLLVLTDSSKLVSLLWHPRYEHQKVYHVTLDHNLSPIDEKKWVQWVKYFDTDDQKEVLLKRKECKHIKDKTYGITLIEWKKRHIRRLFSTLWYEVIDLCRYSFGPWNLQWIKTGERVIKTISSSDVENLLGN